MLSKQKKSVLLVDSLDILVEILCELPTRFSRLQFDLLLQEKTGFQNKSTFESYFEMGKQLKLLSPVSDALNMRTRPLSTLCDHTSEPGWKKALRSLLLAHEPVFSQFLDFLKTPKTENEILEEFNPFTGKTLINWGRDFGSIDFADSSRRYYALARQPPSVNKFWNSLKEKYDILRETSVVGVKSAFVKIPLLRDEVDSLLGITPDEFNAMMARLLEDRQYAFKLELSGAPHAFVAHDGGVPLKYNKRDYYFIAIKT